MEIISLAQVQTLGVKGLEQYNFMAKLKLH